MSVMRGDGDIMETSVTEKSSNVLGDNGNYPEKIRQHAVFNRLESRGGERIEEQPGASVQLSVTPVARVA